MSLLATWISHLLTAAIPSAAIAGLALVAEPVLARCTSPRLRAALWWAVLLRLALPAQWGLLSVSGATESAAARETGSGGTVVALLWLLGSLFMMALALGQHRALLQRWGRADPGPLADSLRAVALSAARTLGLRSSPHLEVLPGAAGPAVLGFLRPRVILPGPWLQRASAEELRHVLLHELTHIRRRDPWAHMVVLVIRSLWWFNPVAWIATKRLATLRELACDAAVARVLGEQSPAYRRTLLALSQRLVMAPIGFLGRPSPLIERLEALRAPRDRRGQTWLAGLSLVGLLACSGGGPAEPSPGSPPPLPFLDADPQGCFQKRMLVFHLLAEEALQSRR